MPWPATTVTTGRGETKKAVAPLIVSASRSTDIPAFYGAWLLRRLGAGYARWINPFSGRASYVSFERTRCIVFWTKNPAPFMPLLGEIDKRNILCYFQVTVNDYEAEGLEKGVPPLPDRIAAFKRLASRIGRERVLWRFDPLVLTDTLSPEALIARMERIGRELSGYTERLTVSFISLYDRVAHNLAKSGIRTRPWDDTSRKQVLRGIGAAAGRWNMQAFTCADGNDYRPYGILRGKCIDDALIARLAGSDETLMEFLQHDGSTKDKGQRAHCGCIPSKDIGAYTTCGHGCAYCYANASPTRAMENLRRHAAASDSII
jgi:hypothetical protein